MPEIILILYVWPWLLTKNVLAIIFLETFQLYVFSCLMVWTYDRFLRSHRFGSLTISLLIGLILLSGPVSLLYMRGLQLSRLTYEECRALMTTWCTKCLLANRRNTTLWERGGPNPDDELIKCAENYFKINLIGKNCTTQIGNCKSFTPI